jgi:hypothetical protein
MSIPLVRRLTRRQSPTTAADPLAGGPRIFLTLAAEGVEPAEDQRSLPRRAFIAFVAVLVLLSAPLYWVATARGADQGAPQAVLAKSGDDDEDEDEQDDDDAGGDDTTGRETAAANTDQPGLETGASTKGETDGGDGTGQTETGQTTGVETAAGNANTDRRGLENGVSTRGETDPGDNTGQTERRR